MRLTRAISRKTQELSSVVWDMPSQWRRMNFLLLLLVAVAMGVGVAFIYGAGQQTGDDLAAIWKRQLLWIAIGGGLMLGFAAIDYDLLGRASGVIYGAAMGLLVLVLLYGSTRNGATSWLRVMPGVTVQPSEFAKLGLIIITARLAARQSVSLQRISHVVPFLLLLALPFGLVLLQPDLGSGLVFVPVSLAIMFISGLRVRWLVYALVAAIVVSPIVWKKGFRDHHRRRVYTFVYPAIPKFLLGDRPAPKANDEAWNVRQSLLAVGSGGMWGKGYMQGVQNALGFLPPNVAPTDFIFSVIAEETGFAGSIALIGVLWGIVLLSVYTAMRARDPFGRNLACGIAVLFCVHIYINIGMTIGMAPIIGIPLPFVSSGGSFMFLMLSCVGILQSIYIRRRTH